jgi:precorrin-4/cobalt-precorrin-4 C11-methyltransferase
MTLEEIINIMKAATEKVKIVARLHTGDPSLYWAIAEKMEILRAEGIDYEVVPGVSSAMAGAKGFGRRERKGKRSKLYDRSFKHEFRKKSQ